MHVLHDFIRLRWHQNQIDLQFFFLKKVKTHCKVIFKQLSHTLSRFFLDIYLCRTIAFLVRVISGPSGHSARDLGRLGPCHGRAQGLSGRPCRLVRLCLPLPSGAQLAEDARTAKTVSQPIWVLPPAPHWCCRRRRITAAGAALYISTNKSWNPNLSQNHLTLLSLFYIDWSSSVEAGAWTMRPQPITLPSLTTWPWALTFFRLDILKGLHCKKRLATFPIPAGMSLTKLSLAGNNLIIPGQEEFCKWHPDWGRENRTPLPPNLF